MSQHSTLNDEPLEAAAEHPPTLKVSIGIMEILFGGFANCVQVVTSAMGILALGLPSEASLIATLSPAGLIQQYAWKAAIAFTIAIAVQLTLHMNAQGISSTYHRLRHIQHLNVKSTSAKSEVKAAIGFKSLIGILAIMADFISDATFVRLYFSNFFVISMWVVFLTASSTILLYDGVVRVWGAIEDAKDYHTYHKMHK
jgi:hypothetical protein